jgi:hypothetical protein
MQINTDSDAKRLLSSDGYGTTASVADVDGVGVAEDNPEINVAMDSLDSPAGRKRKKRATSTSLFGPDEPPADDYWDSVSGSSSEEEHDQHLSSSADYVVKDFKRSKAKICWRRAFGWFYRLPRRWRRIVELVFIFTLPLIIFAVSFGVLMTSKGGTSSNINDDNSSDVDSSTTPVPFAFNSLQ